MPGFFNHWDEYVQKKHNCVFHEIQFYPNPKGNLNFNDFPLGNVRVKVVEDADKVLFGQPIYLAKLEFAKPSLFTSIFIPADDSPKLFHP